MSLEDFRQVGDSENIKIGVAMGAYAAGILALLAGSAGVRKFLEGGPRRRRVREAKKLQKYETSV